MAGDLGVEVGVVVGIGVVYLVTDLKVNLISKFTCCLSVYLSISSVVVVFFQNMELF